MEKGKEEVQEQGMIINDFNKLVNSGKSNQEIYTTIEDDKIIFNLENSCDKKLNDCKGESMRIKDILIKIIRKPLENPEVNEETGEIKEFETKMITILLDEAGDSYVTASKIFTIQWINYIRTFGLQKIKEGLEIKIIEKQVKGSSNKALGFELI